MAHITTSLLRNRNSVPNGGHRPRTIWWGSGILPGHHSWILRTSEVEKESSPKEGRLNAQRASKTQMYKVQLHSNCQLLKQEKSNEIRIDMKKGQNFNHTATFPSRPNKFSLHPFHVKDFSKAR